MRVRLLKGWNGYRAGREFDLPEGQANALIRFRKAEQVDDPPAKPRSNLGPPKRNKGRKPA